MKKFMTAIGVFIGFPLMLMAQTDEDALRYSQLTFGGTARFMGAGGAFGALGADFSSLSFNPAGIGVYRSSELSFSPAFVGVNVKTDYIGNVVENQKYKFTISNFGLVISSDLTKKNSNNKWKRLNVGFGANRLNNYNSEMDYRGYNTDNSLVDYYLEELNSGGGIPPSDITALYPFSSALVWESYLVNPDASNTNYYTSVIPNGNVQQDGRIEENGSTTEYLFSVGSNYDDHLFLGMSFGMPIINYSYSSSYIESDINNSIADFQNFQLYDNVTTDGIGFNGKFGLAYRINDWIRVGGAFHTPTYYYMHDNYYSYINAVLDTSQGDDYYTPDGIYNYDLVTPWRAIAGISIFFQQSGFISVDYEFVDYSAMHYNFKNFSSPEEQSIESELNQTIDAKYGPASNIRAGGEFAYDIWRFRAGVAWYGSPFNADIAEPGYDYSRLSFSGGLGIRTNNFFADVAYVNTSTKEFYQPYSLSDEFVPGVSINKNTGNVVTTFGYKF